MTNLLVMTFPDTDSARRARDVVGKLQREGLIGIEDAAVITRDADGKTAIDNEIDRSVKFGAGAGAVVGALLTFGFPLLGLAIGTAGGALVGKSLNRGLDKSFVEEVERALQPGTSALALVLTMVDNTVLRAALEPFEGAAIYETTLDTELADELRRALK